MELGGRNNNLAQGHHAWKHDRAEDLEVSAWMHGRKHVRPRTAVRGRDGMV